MGFCAEHWHLRWCWLTTEGNFCIGDVGASITNTTESLCITPRASKKPLIIRLRPGVTFNVLGEEQAVRPFAFDVVLPAPSPGARANMPPIPGIANPQTVTPPSGPSVLRFAAGSVEQRDEWFSCFAHFTNTTTCGGAPPISEIVLTPRGGATGPSGI